MAYILMVLSSFFSMLDIVIIKKFQMGLVMDKIHMVLYNFYNSLIASVYFFVGAFFEGGVLKVNGVTLAFSGVFALLVFSSMVVEVFSYSRSSISVVTITKSSGTIIISALFGLLFLKEMFSWKLMLSLILIFIAVILPYLKMVKTDFKKSDMLIYICNFLINGAVAVLFKLYAINPDVKGTMVFFFYTNLILFIGTGIIILANIGKCRKKRESMPNFSVGQIGFVAGRTAAANVVSVLEVVILSRIDISIYTIFISSIALLANTALSKFYFKEKQSRELYVAICLAVLAIILSV